MKIGPFKDASKVGNLKNDRKYISSKEDEKLQHNFIKMIANEIKDNDYSVNVLSLRKKKEKWGNRKKKNMIKDKDNLLEENNLFSDVLGDVGMYETPTKMIDDEKKGLVDKSVYEKTVSGF